MLNLHDGETYPGHGRVRGVEFGGDLSETQRDSEEVECIPGPAEEANEEHKPLVQGQFTKDGNGTSELDLYHLVRDWESRRFSQEG